MPPAVCYLDIETDRNRDIALVGVLTRTHVHHVAYPEAALAGWLDEVLPARGRLYTFNGTAFDLPALRRHTGQDVTGRLAHVDLRAACAAVGLRGGQKAIEAATGFRRDHALLSWGQIFGLCDRYALTGCEWSFGRLVGYNADDLYGMRWIRAHLGC